MTAETGEPDPTTPPQPLFAWHWAGALVAAVAAVPAAYVALHDAQAGAALAVGTLPAAAVGINPLRRKRIALLLAGPLIGVPMVVGAAVAGNPVVALICLCAFAAIGGRLSATPAGVRLGGLITVLVLPMIGIGLSFDDVASALRAGGLFVIGGALVWLASLFVRETAALERPPAERFPRHWWILVSAVAVLTASIGFTLNLDHVGWACGAALLVMRPDADLQRWRTLGRFASVVLGASSAAALIWLAPPNAVYAVLFLVLVALAAGTVGSRFYLFPLFTTFFVILLLGHGDADSAKVHLNERVAETVLGLAVAAVVGIGVPLIARRRAAPVKNS